MFTHNKGNKGIFTTLCFFIEVESFSSSRPLKVMATLQQHKPIFPPKVIEGTKYLVLNLSLACKQRGQYS